MCGSLRLSCFFPRGRSSRTWSQTQRLRGGICSFYSSPLVYRDIIEVTSVVFGSARRFTHQLHAELIQMWITHGKDKWRGFIWNQLPTCARMVCARIRRVSCPMQSWRFLRFLCCHVQADESRSCRGAVAQCSDFKWKSVNASCDFLGFYGWQKYQCSESNTVSGTAGTPDLFAVKSEDFLQAVSQCRPAECGETSGST